MPYPLPWTHRPRRVDMACTQGKQAPVGPPQALVVTCWGRWPYVDLLPPPLPPRPPTHRPPRVTDMHA
eukprot:27075-Eustigmatos_ZCMA.PRE.1